MTEMEIRKPDDFHLHLRDLPAMADVLPAIASRFSRAVIMPNIRPAASDFVKIMKYRERILLSLPEGAQFEPLMTLYLTEDLLPAFIAGFEEEGIFGVKLYPAGATTHSDAGVRDMKKIYPVLEAMQKYNIPLMVHGEVADPDVDIFDRERVFVDRHLSTLVRYFPELRITMEHVSCRESVDFVREAGDSVGATITVHHLMLSRNDLFAGGIRPHQFCMPILKRTEDREAIRKIAVSGHPRFFAGTDSAPHPVPAKERSGGAAGIYTAPVSLESYVEVFEQEGALNHLEAFLSENGARFYGLPLNRERITLKKESWKVPERMPFGGSEVVPFRSGETIPWKIN